MPYVRPRFLVGYSAYKKARLRVTLDKEGRTANAILIFSRRLTLACSGVAFFVGVGSYAFGAFGWCRTQIDVEEGEPEK